MILNLRLFKFKQVCSFTYRKPYKCNKVETVFILSLRVFTLPLVHTAVLQSECCIYLKDLIKLQWFSFETSQSCFPLFLYKRFGCL
jgi:hypothetical protein